MPKPQSVVFQAAVDEVVAKKVPEVVRLEPPLDIPGSLDTLGRWGDDGLDRWDGQRLLRTVREGSEVVPTLARSIGNTHEPALEVTAAEPHLPLVVEAVRTSFVTAHAAISELADRDPIIRRLNAAYPGIRTVLHRDPLTALIRSISAQQVNLRWASEIRRRLGLRYGVEHMIEGETVRTLEPEALAEATIEDLRVLQLTTSKARSVIAVGRAAAAGELRIDELAALDDAVVTERLTALPGIGPWSADWFLARTLGRSQVVAGDLGVRKAVGRAYLEGRMPSQAEVRAVTAHWGAAANVAQQLVLRDLAGGPAAA